MPKHICYWPGCTNRAEPGEAYCKKCQAKQADNRRADDRFRNANDPIRKMYNLARWYNGTRLTVLRRDPLCMECGNHASTDADHHPLSAREIIEQFGVNEFFNPDRCRGLCHTCHSKKTNKQGS